MKLEEMTMKALLAAHNAIAEKPAGPKSFKTKGHLIARVQALAEASGLKKEAARPLKLTKKTKADPVNKADATGATTAPKKPKGPGVGTLARRILIDPSGTPYETIALFINNFIPGAKATPQSVAWYASRMRKDGIDVPKRAALDSICPWIDDPAIADRWLADCGIGSPKC